METYKKVLFLSVAALIVAGLWLPQTSQALTMPGYQLQGQVLGASTSCPTTMDINGDGIVNSMDLIAIFSHLGQDYKPAELDGNSVVDSGDVAAMTVCWFATR